MRSTDFPEVSEAEGIEAEATRRGILIRLALIGKPFSKFVLFVLADEARPPTDGGSIGLQELSDVCQLSTQATLPGDGVIAFRIDWERIASSIDRERLQAAMDERAQMEAR